MWSLTRPDASPDEPVLIVDDRVTGATGDVLAAGVTLGMPRRDAEALAPFATVLLRDIGDEARRFEPVVELIEGLVPRVELISPGLVYVPVSGAIGFYGSETVLADRIAREIDRHFNDGSGVEALIGVADGPFAARWAAAAATPDEPLIVEDTIGFLSRLDLATLRESIGGEELIDTFRWLGIATLGDLARREQPHGRAPEPRAAADVELRPVLAVVADDVWRAEPHHVAERPDLPAVGMAGEL